MSVECPFCQERVNFSRDGICPECDGELSDAQLDSLRRAIQKKRKSNQITCELCGEKNHPSNTECDACGEPFYEEGNSYGNSDGIWRKGKILVMDIDAKLPDICIKTNLPAKGNRLKRKLVWTPLWITLLGGILLGVIFQKVAIVHFGVTRKWQSNTRKRLYISLGVLFLGVALIALGILLFETMDVEGSLFLGFIAIGSLLIGLFLCLGGLVFARLQTFRIFASKITDDYIYIKGANKDYLKRFPQWKKGGAQRG